MKRLNKKTGIAIFTAVMAILAVIILVYHNPLANPQDELLKKVIACVLIVAAVIAFIRLYDKITVLPLSLIHISAAAISHNRRSGAYLQCRRQAPPDHPDGRGRHDGLPGRD